MRSSLNLYHSFRSALACLFPAQTTMILKVTTEVASLSRLELGVLEEQSP